MELTVAEAQNLGGALSPHDVALQLEAQINDAISYAQSRKRRFSRSASAIRLLSLALSVGATLTLGLQQLNFWTGLAFSLVTITTLVNAIEPFFNWRSRWVLMEDMKGQLYRVRDELAYLLLKTPAQDVSFVDLDSFFKRIQDIWADTSQQWLRYRGEGRQGPP